MKRFLRLALAAALLFAGTTGFCQVTAATDTLKPKTLTPDERAYLVNFLRETQAGVTAATKGLSKAQLAYKPAPDKWSIEDCVKHIASAEKNLWAMVAETLKQPVNPEKRADIKISDADWVKGVEDRSHKSKTFAALEPANAPYKTLAEAAAAFKENREKLIAYVQTTNDDLRNHVSTLQMGTFDAYQLLLLIAAHTNRHTQQIEEVKASAGFPKK